MERNPDAKQPWIFYATQRDWCDHVVLHGDGRFERKGLGGSGRWRLWRPDGGVSPLLELQETEATATSTSSHSRTMNPWGRGRNVFVASDVVDRSFEAGSIELRHVGGCDDALPSEGGASSSRRKALVFSSVGSQCLPVVHDHWLKSPDAAMFDVALVHYKEEGSSVYRALEELASQYPFVELHQNKEMKWPNFRHWVALQGGLENVVSRYDYIWVVDDDVRLSTEGINQMFDILRSRPEVQVACPAFDSASDGVWRYFDGHDPKYSLRYTDFVECTAPVLRSSLLLDPMFQRCLKATRTGCFIDFCFHPVTGAKPDSVAIIDAVQCHHPPRGANAPSEMRAVMPWNDHKQDEVFFDEQGLPKEWWWYRQPKVLGGIPAE